MANKVLLIVCFLLLLTLCMNPCTANSTNNISSPPDTFNNNRLLTTILNIHQQHEKIIQLPESIFQNIDQDFLEKYETFIKVIIALSFVVGGLLFVVFPMFLSCGAMWMFLCCIRPQVTQEENELIDQKYSLLPKVSLDPSWKSRLQHQLFDVSFTDCAFLIFWIIFWPFRILSCGIFDSCFILRLTRFQVRRMRIGNRKLDLHISDMLCTIPMVYFINNFCNFYTFGLWRAFGLTHRFYYSRIDSRIFWRPLVGSTQPQEGNYETQVVWHSFSEKNTFKWFSIYCGYRIEFLYWFLKIVNIFSLFILGPYVEAWYIRKKVQHSKFGGFGSFVLVSNGNLQSLISGSPNAIKMSNNLEGCPYWTRSLKFRLLNFITFGIFGYIVGERYILGFIDQHLMIE